MGRFVVIVWKMAGMLVAPIVKKLSSSCISYYNMGT